MASAILVACASAISDTAGAGAAGLPHRARVAGSQAAAAQSALPVTVAFNPLDPGRRVAQRFLGLSFEMAALSQLAQYANHGNLVELLRSLGPGMLRFGGITADENVAWTDSQTPRPAWATSTIGPTQLNELGTLARRSGWQVLLTVGMAHYEPTAAAREVAAAHRALGPYLAAVEIGNEPNSYGSHGFRELPWIAQGYEEQASAYREAIDALTPGVPIAGPDVSGSGAFSEWGEEEALAQSPVLLTGHHYPLGCAQTPPPSIETLLSAAGRGAASLSLASYMAVSELRDIPLRIDEANTVSCGGVAGISNTFASALWATGYITQAMAVGTAGINLQGNPTNCVGYTPLCAPNPTALAEGDLRAQPEWYALLLTRALIGARPLPTTISAEGAPNIVAAGFSGPGHVLKVVLCNNEPEGTSPLSVQLAVGAGMGAAQIQRLTSSSPSAISGVLLAGRAVTTNGSWRAPLRAESAVSQLGTVTVALSPGSAALVTVAPPKPASKSHSQSKHKRK
ncbi:MAG: glycosyl hydrolase family 79 C-terminal domain-containing protein [Solirubrobacteraceae bacterium]